MKKSNKFKIIIPTIALLASIAGCGSKEAKTEENSVVTSDSVSTSTTNPSNDTYFGGASSETTTYDAIINNLNAGDAYANVKVMGSEQDVVLVAKADDVVEMDGKHYATYCTAYVPNEYGCYPCDDNFIGASSPETPLALAPNGSIACQFNEVDITYFYVHEADYKLQIGNLSTYIHIVGEDSDSDDYYVFESADLSGTQRELKGEEAKALFEKEYASITKDMYIEFTVME